MTNTEKTASQFFEKLKAPFDLTQIYWRAGLKAKDNSTAQALPHIDARVVQNRLDEVMGPTNWKNSFQEVFVGSQLFSVRCILMLRVDGEWIAKEDAAQLQQTGSDNYADKNSLIKGAYSDSLKRAAVQWGIGRYLYEYTPEHVALDEKGALSYIPELPDHFLLPLDLEAKRQRMAQSPRVEQKIDAPKLSVAQSTEVKPVVVSEGQQVAPTTKPSKVSNATDSPSTTPQPSSRFTEEQQNTINELTARLETHSLVAIRQYIVGPKGLKALGEEGQAHMLKLLEAKEKTVQKEVPIVEEPSTVGSDDGTTVKSTQKTEDNSVSVVEDVKPDPIVVSVKTDEPDNVAGASTEAETVFDINKLPSEQQTLVLELMERLKKHPPHLIKAYVEGPKGSEKLNEYAKQHILAKVKEKEASLAG